MSRRVFLCLAALVGCAVFFFGGCGSDDNGAGPEPAANIDSVYQEMADFMGVMFDNLDQNPDFDPSQYDFTGFYNYFKNYENHHPNDPKASFGAALMSLMILTTDPDLNELVDTLKNVDDFPDWFIFGAPAPASIPGPTDILSVPTESMSKDFLARSYMGLMAQAISNPPKFSELQDFLRSDILPRILEARGYIDNVLANPNYVFWVPPEMMGETSDSLEIDHTDFLVMGGMLRVLQSFVYIALAFDVDLPSYDAAGIEYMFDQNSGWGGLATDGAQMMINAKTTFMDAVDMANDAITSLQSEQLTDLNQSDDLIIADWSIQDYIKAYAILDSIETYMTAPQQVEIEIGGYVETITVDIRKVFDDPLDGFFSVLPPYSVDVTTGQDTVDYWYDYYGDSLVFVVDDCFFITITFEADTFEEWQFPNTTLNGLFPDFTTDAEFKTFFGIGPEMFRKVVPFRVCRYDLYNLIWEFGDLLD